MDWASLIETDGKRNVPWKANVAWAGQSGERGRAPAESPNQVRQQEALEDLLPEEVSERYRGQCTGAQDGEYLTYQFEWQRRFFENSIETRC